MNEIIKLSVIIPVYNDPKGIITSLRSLISQDFEKPYEVIIVDNNSTDNTYQLIENFIDENQDKTKAELKLLEQDKVQSSYAARNKGIKNANGELICFLDSDMWVNRDYLKKVYKAYQNHKGKYFYMGCNVEIVMEEGNIFEKYNRITGFPIENYIKKAHFAPTCCLVVNKKILNKVGLFNQNLASGGDWELGQRVFESNINQIYNRDMIIFHPARKKFKLLINKSKRVGKGLYQIKKYSRHKPRAKIIKLLIPKSPWAIRNKIINKCIKINFKEFFLIYIICYVCKISNIFGYLEAKFFNN
jgi:glycosyltransferase AglI